MVEGAGFEPAYSERTDLQSVAFNHSATPPHIQLHGLLRCARNDESTAGYNKTSRLRRNKTASHSEDWLNNTTNQPKYINSARGETEPPTVLEIG